MKLRKEVAHLTQADLAAATGLSTGGLRKWEGGGIVSLSTIRRLAEFYGANPAWIITGEGDMLTGDSFLDGLRALEERVSAQGRQLEELVRALHEDPRWPRIEDRLNFLSEQLRRLSIAAQDEDEQGESLQWSPIDLKPEEPKP